MQQARVAHQHDSGGAVSCGEPLWRRQALSPQPRAVWCRQVPAGDLRRSASLTLQSQRQEHSSEAQAGQAQLLHMSPARLCNTCTCLELRVALASSQAPRYRRFPGVHGGARLAVLCRFRPGSTGVIISQMMQRRAMWPVRWLTSMLRTKQTPRCGPTCGSAASAPTTPGWARLPYPTAHAVDSASTIRFWYRCVSKANHFLEHARRSSMLGSEQRTDHVPLHCARCDRKRRSSGSEACPCSKVNVCLLLCGRPLRRAPRMRSPTAYEDGLRLKPAVHLP